MARWWRRISCSTIEPIDTAGSSQSLAVLAAGGVVVAGAVVGAVLMFGGDVRVRDPELAPAPSTAPAADDGLSPGASDSTGERAAASPGVLTTLPSGERSDPEPVKSGTVQGAVETSAADWDPEFAVEIVEELAPTEAAGGCPPGRAGRAGRTGGIRWHGHFRPRALGSGRRLHLARRRPDGGSPSTARPGGDHRGCHRTERRRRSRHGRRADRHSQCRTRWRHHGSGGRLGRGRH